MAADIGNEIMTYLNANDRQTEFTVYMAPVSQSPGPENDYIVQFTITAPVVNGERVFLVTHIDPYHSLRGNMNRPYISSTYSSEKIDAVVALVSGIVNLCDPANKELRLLPGYYTPEECLRDNYAGWCASWDLYEKSTRKSNIRDAILTLCTK